MPFATTPINAAVTAVTNLITHISLLNESLTEITGGSPAYARNALVWGVTASGVNDQDDNETFNVPAGNTVAFVGFENNISTGDGKTLGYWPLGGGTVQAGVAAATGETISSIAHGLANGDRVVFFDVAGGGVPSGLTEGVVYFVVGSAANTFQVSTTLGGSAVNITADGETFFVKAIPEAFGSQGTYTINAGDLDVVGTLI